MVNAPLLKQRDVVNIFSGYIDISQYSIVFPIVGLICFCQFASTDLVPTYSCSAGHRMYVDDVCPLLNSNLRHNVADQNEKGKGHFLGFPGWSILRESPARRHFRAALQLYYH